MKMAPILRQFDKSDLLRGFLVHTGQHYDPSLSDRFFSDLEISDPDAYLGVGSGSHAVQTARVMEGMDDLFDRQDFAALLVVGDVNSTLASALVAAKRRIPVIHVEAGLRSFDRNMPEEINRILTDRISDLLFVTEQSGADNLAAEGIPPETVVLVGNVMIDSLFHARPKAVPAAETFRKALPDSSAAADQIHDYALLTLHRPANVNDPAILKQLLAAIAEIAETLPVWFPVHPRTRAVLGAAELKPYIDHPNFHLAAPASYFEMIGLLQEARLVLTDSGGLQEESSALGIPCYTLRENTERPVTVSLGTNTIVGNSADNLRAAFRAFQAGDRKSGTIPPLWDGKTAARIVEHLENWI